MKLNISALLALATTVAGILSSPAVLNVLPQKWAIVLTAGGALIQAVTKAIHDGTAS